MVGKLKWLALLLAVMSFAARPAFADAYTTSASFQAAIAGLPTATANFDDLTAGTIIPEGGTADRITFHYNVNGGADTLEISNAFDTTSVGEPGGGAGFRLVTERLSVSPGQTCKVGDCNPSGVTKQKSVRLALSTMRTGCGVTPRASFSPSLARSFSRSRPFLEGSIV